MKQNANDTHVSACQRPAEIT